MTFVSFVILSIPDRTSGVEGIGFTCLRKSVAYVPRRGSTISGLCPEEWLQGAAVRGLCPEEWLPGAAVSGLCPKEGVHGAAAVSTVLSTFVVQMQVCAKQVSLYPTLHRSLDQKTGNLMSFHVAIHQNRRISKIV